MQARHLFAALTGCDKKPHDGPEARMTLRRVIPDRQEFLVTKPAFARLHRRGRFDALRGTAVEIAPAHSPTEKAAHNRKDVAPICDLFDRHLIQD